MNLEELQKRAHATAVVTKRNPFEMCGSRNIGRTCGSCGCRFYIFPYQEKKGVGKFCSLHCYNRAPVIERFWSLVEKNGPVPVSDRSIGACWTWKGADNGSGYGKFSFGRKSVYAHRFSFELHVSPIGKLFVLHLCDNPRCVNPDHMRLGTNMDNVADMMSKGRNQRGERHYMKINPALVRRGDSSPSTVISDNDVAKIRKSTESNAELSVRYGVSAKYIGEIKRGRSRKTATG